MAKSAADEGPLNPRDFGITNLPGHVAIIMDGNGRWAKSRGRPRTFGHKEGATAVRRTLRAAYRLGIRHLTLYAFSEQNWNRPKLEVGALMALLVHHIKVEQAELLDLGIRFRALGDVSKLPDKVLTEIKALEARSASLTRMNLNVALSYGGREELIRVMKAVADDVEAGELKAKEVTAATIEERLYTAGLPDPDLLIRTSGELRLSNFLLWQIAYTELYVTDMYWPDFGLEALVEALAEYSKRQRRFGRTGEQVAESE